MARREARPLKRNVGPRTDSCSDCGEPVELYDPNDPDSWIHAIDANYWGDHTAWVKPKEVLSEIQQKSSS